MTAKANYLGAARVLNTVVAVMLPACVRAVEFGRGDAAADAAGPDGAPTETDVVADRQSADTPLATGSDSGTSPGDVISATIDPCTSAPTLEPGASLTLDTCDGTSSNDDSCRLEGPSGFARLAVPSGSTAPLSIHATGGSYYYYRIYQGGCFLPSCRGVTGGGFAGPDVTVQLGPLGGGPLWLAVDVQGATNCGTFDVTLGSM